MINEIKRFQLKNNRVGILILSFLPIWQEWRQAVRSKDTTEHIKLKIWKQLCN